MLTPVLLLPGLAWGAAGRLRPVLYPASWLRARALIEADHAPGSVLLLPWAAYRRYGWNHGEAVLDPWPRLLSRTVIWNDAVQVGSVVIPAETAAARRLTRLVTSTAPLTAALRRDGVRYVIVDVGVAPTGAAGGAAGAAGAGAGGAGGGSAGAGGTGVAGAAGLTKEFAARLAGAATMLAGPDLVLYRISGTAAAVPVAQAQPP
jgi:hypothetical protein